jgi:hypothetical protein
MKYISIASAHDWYYVIPRTATVKDLTVWPLAVWALNADGGEIIGLVSNPLSDEDQKAMGQRVQKLLTIPPLPGVYKHRAELTLEEQEALRAIHEGYDAWLMAKLDHAMTDPHLGIPHDEVMAKAQAIIDRKRANQP